MSALVPFVLGRPEAAARLAAHCPLAGCAPLDVYVEREIFSLLLAGNAESYGGLAMPAWVLLDCAALPAGVIGFARARRDVDDAVYARLVARAKLVLGSDSARALERWHGLVPLAEFACVPTAEPGHVVGFSLFSLEKGLGVRTKAMALVMHRARRQTGVAQVGGRALRAHATIGELEVKKSGIAVHERAQSTIAYELTLTDRDRLRALSRGLPVSRAATGDTVTVPVDDRTVAVLEEMRGRGRVLIVDADERVLRVRALSETKRA